MLYISQNLERNFDVCVVCRTVYYICAVVISIITNNCTGMLLCGIWNKGQLYWNLQHSSLRWRHNDHDGDWNHQPHHCLLNCLFGRRSEKTSKLRVTVLCAGNSPGTGEIPAQMASNAENVFIWWRHHDSSACQLLITLLIHHGSLLQGKISKTSIGIMEWISNYIDVKQWEVITHPRLNLNHIWSYNMHQWLHPHMLIDVITCPCLSFC